MEQLDGELLEQWRGGDAASGEVLFERYYHMVERFFVNKVSSAVQDLVQETFIWCTEGRERIRDTDRFRLYLFGIAYNVLGVHLRERYRGGRVVCFDDDSLHDLAPGPSTLLARRREHQVLIEALRKIPVDDQVILELHYWEQLTTHQVAEVLGIPVGTARGRLQRARSKLEKAMRRLAESPQWLTARPARATRWSSAAARSGGVHWTRRATCPAGR